ncbi:MAG: hypothetical protein Q7J65_03710, partial [Candidatus Marinimicrobia bacterium]|nr:hypothetical protein [Candidatus Neomarinimicrobiota bacterium]
MENYSHKSKTELIAEIKKLRQVVDQSAPSTNNLMQQCDDLTLINDLNTAVIQQKPLADILS